ncbi:sterol 3beta-glucosyltransferase [Malassezia vespertilionis]|uniref:sterol 3beta-glucosyltransferase n=1 Tax=Malassezia vespertilionis TaxID=2020962 RepID=A0A2N1J7E0_9BASI|nr:sterol 3beta-glucosyltransferase [Malassezia vespertilionis]PKI82464.1 Atg26p [Malassezia vespertilionis]WFD08034.1 sterol 3beta-glucosyltransferase [Malassezia vespertilionis]
MLNFLQSLGNNSAQSSDTSANSFTPLPAVVLPRGERIVHSQTCRVLRDALIPARLVFTETYLCFAAWNKEASSIPEMSFSSWTRKKSLLPHHSQKLWLVLHTQYLCWYDEPEKTQFLRGYIDVLRIKQIEKDVSRPTHLVLHVRNHHDTFIFEDEAERNKWAELLEKVKSNFENAGELPAKTVGDFQHGSVGIPLERIIDVVCDKSESLEASLLGIRALTVEDGPSTWVDFYFADIDDQYAIIKLMASLITKLQGPEAPHTLPGLDLLPFAPWAWSKEVGVEVEKSKLQALIAANTGHGRVPNIIWTDQEQAPEPTDDESVHSFSSQDKSKSFFNAITPSFTLPGSSTKLDGIMSKLHLHKNSRAADDDASSSDDDDDDDDQEKRPGLRQRQFVKYFPVSEAEHVRTSVGAAHGRVLPTPGRIFLSKHHFAFRANRLVSEVTSGTRIFLSMSDIVSVTKTTALNLFGGGLVLVLRGTEEQFFDFPTRHARDKCYGELQAQLYRIEGERELATAMDPPRHTETMPDISIKPLHITMLTIGSRGDVQPYVVLAKRLQALGHRVRIATHPEFREFVEEHGVDEFREMGGDPSKLMSMVIENGTFSLNFIRAGIAHFRPWFDGLLQSSWEACQGTDLIIESPSVMAGPHIADALAVPLYHAFTMPWTQTRAYPQAFAVPKSHSGGQYNAMTYTLFEQVLWSATSSQINRWRQKTLKIRPTTVEDLALKEVPIMYNFSQYVVPKPKDWGIHTHITGYWFLETPDEPPSDEIVEFIKKARAANKKLVYIGWGSIIVPDPDAMSRAVRDAVETADVYCILSMGWSGRGQEKPKPMPPSENIFTVKSIAHDWVFPKIDAACHHGGAGTTGASVRAGIPTVIHPFFGDQYFWAKQVENMGIGIAVQSLTAESMTSALRRATTDEVLYARSSRIGRLVRGEDGVGNAVDTIYRELPYVLKRAEERAKRNQKERKSESRWFTWNTVPKLSVPSLGKANKADDAQT